MLLILNGVFVCVCGAGKSCQCSPSYPLLLLTLFTATGLLLLAFCWLALDKRVSNDIKNVSLTAEEFEISVISSLCNMYFNTI